MHFILQTLIVCCSFLLIDNGEALEINSKLDFGGEDNVKAVTTREALVSLKSNTNSDFDKIGVVCTSGGCNKTKTKEENIIDTKDTITADVLVQVRTKINFDEKGKNKSAEDIPDVPVVIGYAGVTDKASESEITVEQGRSINSNPILTSSFIPTFTEIDQRIQAQRAYIPSLSSTNKEEPKVHIKPPLNITTKEDDRAIKNDENKKSVELQIPYFEPSYNNHYFSENVPAQVVWYPKNTVHYNPVEFKNKRTWNAQSWTLKTPIYHQKQQNSQQYVKCTCENNNNGLHWYPSRSLHLNQPDVQIDDKLAPLN